jgi:hypothetical protein
MPWLRAAIELHTEATSDTSELPRRRIQQAAN